MRKAELFYRVT